MTNNEKGTMRYFTVDEFNCQHTGNNRMEWAFMEKVDFLREACGFPFVITSGYRDPTHPIEAGKGKPGAHSRGVACDIRVSNGEQLRTLVWWALKMGFKGIGVSKGFVHVDMDYERTGEVMWTY